eukprot:TRINITY_DN16845_c0_g1_i1.p1 TRINITY_DN16845_c0_g1~~TRINITY_DN16845_c0_g1_i1.p1  ORF type:complete len:148 (-),score=53.69 TRINITY_DN16845_c0_g1_i1:113-556(-)
MGQGCCAAGSDTSHEQLEQSAKKEVSPGAVTLPAAVEPPVSKPAAAAAEAAGGAADGCEYNITLDKTTGTRLGVDVDHQDGATLLIDAVTGGLMQAWNEANTDDPSVQVKPGDRIVEVNGIKDDVLQLVNQCKNNQVLKMKIRRGTP